MSSSSSESEFRYDGGEVTGGASGYIIGYVVVSLILIIAFVTLFVMAYLGKISPAWTVKTMSSEQIAYVTANYSPAPVSGTAVKGTCVMDATSKAFTCTAPAKEIDPKTGDVKVDTPATENLSVIWKDKMLSSGSNSAWGKSMYRAEGMCGQC